MKRKLLHTLSFITAFILAVYACNKPSPEVPDTPDIPDTPEVPSVPDTPDQPEPAELKDLNLSVPVTENWIFKDKPSITFQIENPNDVAVTAHILMMLSSDLKVTGETVEQDAEIPAKSTQSIVVTTSGKLDPGFYRARCFVNKRTARIFFFGINPTEIVSAPDMQPDFDQFWATAKAQLAAIDMEPRLTEITSRSNASCKVYMVEINSVPDGLEGDPVVVRGYYLEPQDGQPHPVIMHFYGYDSQNPGKLSCPAGGNGQFAEFYLSHRGQYINNRTADKRESDGHGDFVNTYGDWFAFNFGNRDGYYYRGAFMDCVQAVRFMAGRPSSDMSNLFAEGSSQGGALCYAAAALSDYPFTAIAPNVAFLGDYPDYFKIVSWPGDVAKNNKGSMTDEQMYAFLSYFDTKNLATRISCAVYATSGLQDGTCPPHTNLAPYNNLLSTDKEMHFYPEMQHAYPPNWNSDIMKFFKARIK